MPNPTTLPINKATENYIVKLVHVTRPETVNAPCNFAFEVTDPRDNIPMIALGEVNPIVLYNYFRDNNWLHKRGSMAGKAIGQVTTFPGKRKRTWNGRKKNGPTVGATGTG